MISTAAFRRAAPVDASERESEIFLIDGSGFIFRAFHALPPLSRPDGTPVGAVMGFASMLAKLVTEMHVPNVAVVFDAARRNYRNDIYPAYKANRAETPPELIPQFPLIRAATAAFAIPALEEDGFEADDLIATYARLACEAGRPVTIVSSDKDLMQLIRPGVRMFDPMKYKYLGEAEVLEKFGVPPSKVVDVQALAGDATDNVPGVPGIGVKTAAQLINEYGDLDTLLARAGEIKQPKRREALTTQAEMARVSKKLVALNDQAPASLALDDLKARAPDAEILLGFLREQGFKTLTARMEQRLSGTAPAVPAAAVAPAQNDAPYGDYETVRDAEALKRWIARAQEAGVVAIDTETTSLTPSKAALVGISLSVAPGQACYIPLGHRAVRAGELDFAPAPAEDVKQMPEAEALRLLQPLLEDDSVLKVGHNIKYDMQMFLARGVNVAPVDDTMLISYTLDGVSHSHGMDALSAQFLNHETIKYEDVTGSGKAQVTFDLVPVDKAAPYAAEDADVTLRLHRLLKPRLAREGMTAVYETLDRPLAPVIAAMELAGVRVDKGVLETLSAEFGAQMATLEARMHALAGYAFNVGSPKQLGDVLFGAMGLPGGKKTKTGAWSTGADTLDELALQGHEIAAVAVEWREVAKLKSTYSDALVAQINPATGRVHTSFSLTGTSTGRLASSEPNLQNIPIRTENGRKIRAAFIPAPGHVFLSADYSQVELRLAAAMSGAAALKKAFADGVDIHAATAAQVFGVPQDQVTADLRRSAKAINFGIIYGISGFGLARQLGIPQGQAADYIRRYLDRLPELKTFMEAQKAHVREHGYVRTFHGRKCFVRGAKDVNPALRAAAERQAINAPLQGTAADVMKKAMIALPPALEKAGLKSKMLLQVHDELLIEVPEAERDQAADTVRAVMMAAGAGIDVSLDVSLGFGATWAEAH